MKHDFGDLDELSLAYDLSVHKSQVSAFPCVVILVHTHDAPAEPFAEVWEKGAKWVLCPRTLRRIGN